MTPRDIFNEGYRYGFDHGLSGGHPLGGGYRKKDPDGAWEGSDSQQATRHKWKSQRQGGSPVDASSDDKVVFCDHCGTEQTDDNRDDACLYAISNVEPISPPINLIDVSTAENIAQELRCDVSVKRCRDDGRRHGVAKNSMGPEWRCATCRAYEFLLTRWPSPAAGVHGGTDAPKTKRDNRTDAEKQSDGGW